MEQTEPFLMLCFKAMKCETVKHEGLQENVNILSSISTLLSLQKLALPHNKTLEGYICL